MRLVKIPYKNAVGNNEEPVGDQVNRQISLVAEGVVAYRPISHSERVSKLSCLGN